MVAGEIKKERRKKGLIPKRTGKSGSFISSRRVRDETKLLVMHVAGGARFWTTKYDRGGRGGGGKSPTVQSSIVVYSWMYIILERFDTSFLETR